jgi:Putative auto-transporter adhesin, head GIN domain
MAISAPARSGGRAAAPRGGRGLITAIVVSVVAVLVLAVAVVTMLARAGSPGSGVRGSGVAASQSRVLAQFSSLDLRGSNNVTIAVGRRQSVVVHADSNLLRDVTTRVAAGTLVVGTVGSFAARSPMSVEVSVPSLSSVALSGSGQVSVTGIDARRLTVTLPGSGTLSASGTVAELNVTLGGSGLAQLGNLAARDVHAVLTGSGLIRVTATARLNAAVSGSGAIIYNGSPQVTSSVTGSGAVTPG